MKTGALVTTSIATLALAGGMYLLLRPSDGDGNGRTPEHRSSALAPQWTGPQPREVAEKFTRATATAERLKWVRNPARVAPLVEAFFDGGPGTREQVVDLQPMGQVQTTDVLFQGFRATLDDGLSRLLAVVVTEEGATVDFECYARHGSESWPDLLSGAATEAETVRVLVRSGAYYNYRFSDDKVWRSLVASSPDFERPIYFYTRRGSEADDQLSKFAGRRPVRVTLAIRSLEDSHQHRQFEISTVHSRGWVVADSESAAP